MTADKKKALAQVMAKPIRLKMNSYSMTLKLKKSKQVNHCPLCGKSLKQQDERDIIFYGNKPVTWCPTVVKLQGGKQKFHYEFNPNNDTTNMIVMPYRIVTDYKQSTISIHIPPDLPDASDNYKSGKWLFKTVFSCHKISPMEQFKLLKKIQTLIIYS